MGGGVSQVGKGKKTSVVIEELNEEGLNQEGFNEQASGQGKELNQEGFNEQAGGQGSQLNQEGFNEQAGGEGKELNEEGLTDEAFTKGKEKATVNSTVNNEGSSDKGKGKHKVTDDMSQRFKAAFGKKKMQGIEEEK
ncbi:hypothetical protein ACE6H2_018271 [Prunus campanulata]